MTSPSGAGESMERRGPSPPAPAGACSRERGTHDVPTSSGDLARPPV
jgi:hypothetical protein